ncbi:maleylpyruvate isomerase family mycothiol-dependent enzyme [Mycolicibacterium neoaurum]|uniref:maleylpyruvate isomerase family mycothiol-dependent enzyme n=1 Tax=Mycolicibacterium neoaurum TaxID=1795 RepID=UPI00248AF683|nr:maleylpyruvate isomerase family mycothiol-dependent enzyme [Mycolicibacterium neoaurum]WBP93710.1 maleylpyruvate isomerase family mycothiol-dependent enzyme [Mycolicibacterium neoaurum]WBS07513.1 maleylpyruvate isomerase family mycothiol-dependent enzyme [Mycolicibacterium neoaurum]
MDNQALLERLHKDALAIAAVALAGGPTLVRQVPTCPDWTVSDLLGHLGQVQDWVCRMLRTREYAEERPVVAEPQRAVEEFISGVSGYLIAMRSITPDEPCWAFGPEPHLCQFWIRRQAHEHAVHRVDLESVFGTTPDIEPEFAADGVDELLTLFRGPATHPSVLLSAADTGDTWRLGDGDPTAVITADAKTLYLGLWKRIDLLEQSRVDGDRHAAEQAVAG